MPFSFFCVHFKKEEMAMSSLTGNTSNKDLKIAGSTN